MRPRPGGVINDATSMILVLRSFAPSSSLATSYFHRFGSTLIVLNEEVTRVITCFARVTTTFAGIPEKILHHVIRFGVFSH